MSRTKAILLTILGIVAAWFIIRGINAWAEKHETTAALEPVIRAESSVLCAPSVFPSV